MAGDRFMIDELALGMQLGRDAPHAVEGMGGIDFIDAPLQGVRCQWHRWGLMVEMRPIETEQSRLTG